MTHLLALPCSLISLSIVKCVLSENYNLNYSAEYLLKNSQLEYIFSATNSESIVFKRIASISLEACTNECGYRPECNGVAFQRRFPVCNLLFSSSVAVVKKQRGVVLVKGFNKGNDGSVETVKNITECGVADIVFETKCYIYDVWRYVQFDGKDNGVDLVHIREENGQWEFIRKGLLFSITVDTHSMVGDCSDVTGPSGIYWVPQTNSPIFCDSRTEDGPWMVFQRREDGSVDFYRNWANYTRGFGSIGCEFWIGLHSLHELTASHTYGLRIDMVAFNGSTGYATYSHFSIESSENNFKLKVFGFDGNVGDSMSWHNLSQFSTFDHDNDLYPGLNCAEKYTGAWWYNACHNSNLNGLYSNCGSDCGYAENINWSTWLGQNATLVRTEMKIKRNY